MRSLHDAVDRGRHLHADRSQRKLNAAHHGAGFHTSQRINRTVRVNGRHGAGVTGVHRLQEVKRLAAADFSDDQTVRTQTQRRNHKVAD